MNHRRNFRIFDHTADLGIEIYGADPADLFVNAGHALFAALLETKGPAPVDPHHHTIDIQGDDWPDLMMNWLRELLYLFNGDRQVLADIHVDAISEHHVKARVTTEDLSPGRHRVEKEIKAVTYHQLEAGPQGDRWMARVIVDI